VLRAGVVAGLAAALGAGGVAGAQPSALAFGTYRLDTWRAGGGLPDGLPSNNVNFLAESADGYLWLATPAGLTRFDGSRFTLVTPTAAPALRGRLPYLTWPLLLDRGGTLWVTTDQGVVRYANGAFLPAAPDTTFRDEAVQALAEDGRGVIHGVTVRGSVFRLDRGRAVRVPLPGIPAGDGFAVVADTDGTVWVARDRAGLVRVRDGHAVRLGPPVSSGTSASPACSATAPAPSGWAPRRA
jgi:ligand-binding sensor domain-containing protein